MSEWQARKLGEVLNVHHGWAFKGEFFSEAGELIVLTPGNFVEKGGFKPKSGVEKYYLGTFPEKYLLPEGAVVVAMTEQSEGLLGSSATIPESRRYLHNQRIGLLEVTDPEALELRFAYHLMNSPDVRQQIQATSTGSKVRHTAPERIRDVAVDLPPLPAQRVIAGVLDAIERLILNNLRRAEALEEMAQAIYREWFVQFRYPGHESVRLVDSVVGPIPEGWALKSLAEIAEVNRSSRKPTADEVFKYLDITALGEREIGELRAISGSEAPGRARRLLSPGDTVWATVRPNRRAHALVVAPGEDWIASTGLAVLTPMSVSPAFLFETTSTTAFSDWLVGRATGSAYPAVRANDFEEVSVLVPDTAVDAAFAEKVGLMHELSWRLRSGCTALVSLRDLLLPKLVTGRIDVSRLDFDALFEDRVA